MQFSLRSKLSVILSLVGLAALVSALLVTTTVLRTHAAAPPAAVKQVIRHVTSGGAAAFSSSPQGKDGVQQPEINSTANGLGPSAVHQEVNRSSARPSNVSASVQGSAVSTASGRLQTSFDGLDFRQNRLASNGNQFSLEPPDQGLCVGNGFVLETINDVLRVYDTHGNPLSNPTALNAFYGYAPAITRTSPPTFGPFVTDPSCYYDVSTQRWFHNVLTLDTNPNTDAFLGTNHLDLAVSDTSSPLGSWTIYSIPAQDDGTQGTPNHHCDSGPCLGDYPHIGADANGFYITTNEYGLFATGLGFHAAQIYALPKLALAANASSITFVQIDTIGLVGSPGAGLPGNPGFTVWPSTAPDGHFATALNGTEYFMSSDAAPEANGIGSSRDLVVWGLSDTATLNTASPTLNLAINVLTVNPYSIPAKATQKKGNVPLATCLNTSSCSALILGGADPFTEVEGQLDTNDTRMQQVTYAAGKLWGALDTAVTVGQVGEAGIEWFIVDPVSPKVLKQGYLGGNNANLIYPAIGVTSAGKGVMTFTLVGPNNYPSAAYTSIDAQNGLSSIYIAANGKGPQDGFTEYKVFGTNGVPRPRWGDYGAAVPVGNSIWIASEYINQTCTYAQYIQNTPTSPLFSCNMTRTALGNWATRISQVAAN
jgi:hypothetical protein